MRKKRRPSKKSYLPPLFIVVLVVIFSSFSFVWEPYHYYDWSGIRPEVKDSIIKFSQDSYYMSCGSIGYLNDPPEQEKRYQYLKKNLTFNEALKLKDFPESKVKAIAFDISVRKDATLTYPTMLEALNDTTTHLFYISGCIADSYSLAEYLNIYAFGLGLDSIPSHQEPIVYLTKYQYKKLDSLYKLRTANKWDY